MKPQVSEGLSRKGGVSDPFAVFRQMDRWLDDVRREFGRTWTDWPAFGTSLRPFEAVREPAVDVRDAGAELVVAADLPGVSKDDVEIKATPEGLEIRAAVRKEREEKDEDYVFRERNYSEFYRSLPLPAEVIPDKVVAELKDGTLEVHLPKKEPTPAPKAVNVKVA